MPGVKERLLSISSTTDFNPLTGLNDSLFSNPVLNFTGISGQLYQDKVAAESLFQSAQDIAQPFVYVPQYVAGSTSEYFSNLIGKTSSFIDDGRKQVNNLAQASTIGSLGVMFLPPVMGLGLAYIFRKDIKKAAGALFNLAVLRS